MNRRSLALLLFVPVFWGAFAWQRARSPMLRAEAEAPAARELARQVGMPVVELLALRVALGVDRPAADWHEAAHRYAVLRPTHGGPLAAAAIGGHAAAVNEALATAAGDSERAFRILFEARGEPGLLAERFRAAYERLSVRAAAAGR